MKITGAEVIARSLIANGITHVFNVPGLGIQPLIDALRQHSEQLQYYCGPSETSVSLMADGYGRATGSPAFVNVYHASGTALAMVGVTTAWADRSPMVFTTTTTSRRLARSDGYASVPREITEMSRQFVKWDWEVPAVERIPEAIARAVAMACTPPMGPVHLAFPADLYVDEIDEIILRDLILASPRRLNTYAATRPDIRGVTAAADLLTNAERPVIVSGGDIARYHAVQALISLAESLGAPVFGEPYVAYMGFPNSHSLFAGRFSGNHPLVKAADVVLMLGTELTGGGGAPLLPPLESRVIFVTSDIMDLGKQVWADVGLVGHPRTCLEELTAAATKARGVSKAPWESTVRAELQRFRGGLETTRRAAASTAYPGITIPEVIDTIEAVFGDQMLFVDQSTTGTAYMLEMMRFDDPRRYFGISGRASAQGWGVPAAIGMQIARPEQRVVAVVGDGGFMFTGTSLYAAAQWNIPLVVIVLSNGGWHDVAYVAKHHRGWSDADLHAARWVASPKIDFAALARSIGVHGSKASTSGELRFALDEALAVGGPCLVEVDSDPAASEYYMRFVTT